MRRRSPRPWAAGRPRGRPQLPGAQPPGRSCSASSTACTSEAGSPRIRGCSERVDAGARVVRIDPDWSRVAPATRPAGFDPADPADPAYNWTSLDAGVRAASSRGMEVLLAINGAPRWAEGSRRAAAAPNRVAGARTPRSWPLSRGGGHAIFRLLPGSARPGARASAGPAVADLERAATSTSTCPPSGRAAAAATWRSRPVITAGWSTPHTRRSRACTATTSSVRPAPRRTAIRGPAARGSCRSRSCVACSRSRRASTRSATTPMACVDPRATRSTATTPRCPTSTSWTGSSAPPSGRPRHPLAQAPLGHRDLVGQQPSGSERDPGGAARPLARRSPSTSSGGRGWTSSPGSRSAIRTAARATVRQPVGRLPPRRPGEARAGSVPVPVRARPRAPAHDRVGQGPRGRPGAGGAPRTQRLGDRHPPAHRRLERVRHPPEARPERQLSSDPGHRRQPHLAPTLTPDVRYAARPAYLNHVNVGGWAALGLGGRRR